MEALGQRTWMRPYSAMLRVRSRVNSTEKVLTSNVFKPAFQECTNTHMKTVNEFLVKTEGRPLNGSFLMAYIQGFKLSTGLVNWSMSSWDKVFCAYKLILRKVQGYTLGWIPNTQCSCWLLDFLSAYTHFQAVPS